MTRTLLIFALLVGTLVLGACAGSLTPAQREDLETRAFSGDARACAEAVRVALVRIECFPVGARPGCCAAGGCSHKPAAETIGTTILGLALAPLAIVGGLMPAQGNPSGSLIALGAAAPLMGASDWSKHPCEIHVRVAEIAPGVCVVRCATFVDAERQALPSLVGRFWSNLAAGGALHPATQDQRSQVPPIP